MSDLFSLNGKVAIVTGAAQGIGAVYALGLARQGAKVAVCDLLDPAAVVKQIAAAGGTASGRVLNVTDAAAVAAFVRDVEAELGPVDILVNNAALFGGLPRKPFTEIMAQEWDHVMNINTLSVLECTKAVVPGMRQRGGGRVINISSTTVHSGVPMLLHYVASKGAVLAMTRCMARELGDYGITVNALAPGLTMSEAVRNDAAPATIAATVQKRSLKRDQMPEDLLGALLFLASPASDFITGQTYVIDGGTIMQ